MKINLTQKETQAILCAINNQLNDLNKIRKRDGGLNTGWEIMFDDFKSCIKKLTTQYFKQVKENK